MFRRSRSALRPPVRGVILVLAGVSKAAFIALVLAYARDALNHPAGVAVVADAFWVIVFALYFLGLRSRPRA